MVGDTEEFWPESFSDGRHHVFILLQDNQKLSEFWVKV